MKKMILTSKLANNLMKNLVCLIISANGGYPEEGFTDDEMKAFSDWGKETLLSLCDSFEDDDHEWDFLKND